MERVIIQADLKTPVDLIKALTIALLCSIGLFHIVEHGTFVLLGVASLWLGVLTVVYRKLASNTHQIVVVSSDGLQISEADREQSTLLELVHVAEWSKQALVITVKQADNYRLLLITPLNAAISMNRMHEREYDNLRRFRRYLRAKNAL